MMRSIVLLLVLLLIACTPKSAPMLHTVRMYEEGPRLYAYRIEYGETILPYGNRGAPDYDGKYIYQSSMALPEVAVVTWRTALALDGEKVRFEVPIRAQVKNEEWRGEHFALEFHSTPKVLKVYVTNGSTWPPGSIETRRLIYSAEAKPRR